MFQAELNFDTLSTVKKYVSMYLDDPINPDNWFWPATNRLLDNASVQRKGRVVIYLFVQ